MVWKVSTKLVREMYMLHAIHRLWDKLLLQEQLHHSWAPYILERQWTRQQLSHVYQAFAVSALSRQFPSGCLSNQAKSQPHAQSRILMCNFRVEILLWGWPRKHTVTPQSHTDCDPLWDLQVAWRFLTPPSRCSGCVSSTYLRQAPPGRKEGGGEIAANLPASHNTNSGV